MRTQLVLYLALEAVLKGQVDVSARLAEVEPLLDEVSRWPLSTPPPARA
jgi:hypothetical protein